MTERISRRDFVKRTAMLTAAGLVGCRQSAPRESFLGGGLPEKPNIVIFLTDGQRQTQHWPDGWVTEHLPSMQRLRNNGLTFENNFCPASMCTAARASLFTGTYPDVHGVGTREDLPLDPQLTTLPRLLAQQGYTVLLKGKWDLSVPEGGKWTNADIEWMSSTYGFRQWNPPDAGTGLELDDTAGGGTCNNDGRFVSGVTEGDEDQTQGVGGASVLDFINKQARATQPFCLIVSLVNPHDIAYYPDGWQKAGYRASDFRDMGIPLPPNGTDDLTTKPTVQRLFRDSFSTWRGAITTEAQRRDYVNLYAYLHKLVDREFSLVLDALEANGLTDDTLIVRCADHGEMGMSHGLRQKMENAYDETIRLPLIFSNPRLFRGGATTDAFASNVDLVPTLAAIAGVPRSALPAGCGRDLSPVLRDPRKQVQQGVLFAYEDRIAGGPVGKAITTATPWRIRAWREPGWLYAVYFDSKGTTFEYELYDMANDPGQLRNLANARHATRKSKAEQERLHQRLSAKLDEVRSKPKGVTWPTG